MIGPLFYVAPYWFLLINRMWNMYNLEAHELSSLLLDQSLVIRANGRWGISRHVTTTINRLKRGLFRAPQEVLLFPKKHPKNISEKRVWSLLLYGRFLNMTKWQDHLIEPFLKRMQVRSGITCVKYYVRKMLGYFGRTWRWLMEIINYCSTTF